MNYHPAGSCKKPRHIPAIQFLSIPLNVTSPGNYTRLSSGRHLTAQKVRCSLETLLAY
jgi:hypothetical protein